MDQAITLGTFAVAMQYAADLRQRLFNQREILFAQTRCVLPAPPVPLRANHGVVVPDNAAKTDRWHPALAVLMQTGGDRAQLCKGARVNVGGRHVTVNPVEH